MAKRNCRRNLEESKNHEYAVKIRKMTDAQLCEYLENLKQNKVDEEEIIQNYIDNLYFSQGNGIGKATIQKLKNELDVYINGRRGFSD